MEKASKYANTFDQAYMKSCFLPASHKNLPISEMLYPRHPAQNLLHTWERKLSHDAAACQSGSLPSVLGAAAIWDTWLTVRRAENGNCDLPALHPAGKAILAPPVVLLPAMPSTCKALHWHFGFRTIRPQAARLLPLELWMKGCRLRR